MEENHLKLRKIFRGSTSSPMATKCAHEVSRVWPKCAALSLLNAGVEQVENGDSWGVNYIMRKKKRTQLFEVLWTANLFYSGFLLSWVVWERDLMQQGWILCKHHLWRKIQRLGEILWARPWRAQVPGPWTPLGCLSAVKNGSSGKYNETWAQVWNMEIFLWGCEGKTSYFLSADFLRGLVW